MENFPGFTDGIMGPELMGAMRGQAERFGAEIVQGNVDDGRPVVQRRSWCRTDEAEYRAQALIIATGASARLLGLPVRARS